MSLLANSYKQLSNIEEFRSHAEELNELFYPRLKEVIAYLFSQNLIEYDDYDAFKHNYHFEDKQADISKAITLKDDGRYKVQVDLNFVHIYGSFTSCKKQENYLVGISFVFRNKEDKKIYSIKDGFFQTPEQIGIELAKKLKLLAIKSNIENAIELNSHLTNEQYSVVVSEIFNIAGINSHNHFHISDQNHDKFEENCSKIFTDCSISKFSIENEIFYLLQDKTGTLKCQFTAFDDVRKIVNLENALSALF